MSDPKVYLVLDKINPRLRSIGSAILIVAGFLIQTSTRNILAGMPFILMCLLLNLIKGVSIKAVAPNELGWKEVTPDRIDQVLTHCRKIKKFRSQNLGCFIGFVIALIVFGSFAFSLLESLSLPFSFLAAVIDAAVLFSGLILSGRKSAWMPHALDVKAEIVQRIIQSPIVKNDPDLLGTPYLEIGHTEDGDYPNDTRIMIKFKDAPDAFIGLQGQISINTVKSSAYPYFYTVLIARPEFRLLDKFKSLKISLDNITLETKKTGEVDVVVIRQTTTKTSGYHTAQKMQDYILLNSIKMAKKLV
ncbi:hypothetical protein AMJ74_00960 [candidate division WOR_3 bacterium SM1_77]|uniref:Uncharacterized protein n=1 Tax=candidate division WOR_3 bacterium SM1_77 TaxID=1703778 RepID=A0A0S8K132_UNCW3|nr:MAG: hypothetical protein AMJ74_00960 [candidate division WOR_3 bacterium SM1_77]